MIRVTRRGIAARRPEEAGLTEWVGGAVVAVTVAAATSLIWSTIRYGTGPYPSGPAATAAVRDALPADLTGEIHDLGCGLGTLLLALARSGRFPQARFVGHEASFVAFVVAWTLARTFGGGRVTVRWGDVFEADLSRAAAVVCFLVPETMIRLARRLPEVLPSGALVVSHTFALPGWKPLHTSRIADIWTSPLYVYRVDPGARGSDAPTRPDHR